jgi:hypothetical protein
VCCKSASAVLGVQAAFAAPMTQDEYRVTKERIEAEYRDSKAACERLVDHPKDVCREEAKAKDKVARAELEYNRSGSPKDANRLAETRADAAYAVARERCDDRKGRDKDLCVNEAKTAHIKAIADAKAAAKVGEARRDAAEDKREADFNLAKEKCEMLAGDNKAACLVDARARYGKS